jgi:hypothetical protein
MLRNMAIAGALAFAVGCFAAALADVFPSYRRALQSGGGSLLVGGTLLIGLALPLI